MCEISLRMCDVSMDIEYLYERMVLYEDPRDHQLNWVGTPGS